MATLYDAYGRPIDLAALKEEKAEPSLAGVRQVIGGHPAQGLTPSRLAGILREAENGDPTRYLELAEEMEEKDLHYLSVLQTRKRQVAQLKITVEPASDSADDVANADLVQGFLDREELEDELFDILDAVGKGFSVTEIVWDMSAGQWMPQRLEWRMPQWFVFDRDTGTTILRREITGYVELEPFKFVRHKVRAKSGLPIRGGLARAAAWSYLFKNYDVKDWVQFAETYGQPLRVGKYPASATPEDRAVLLRAVAAIGTDAAAIIPESMMIEFVKDSTGSATADIYERLAAFLDAQVSKAVLGQTLTTQEGDSGSYSLGKVHDEVRGDIERSDARQLAATLNRDLVRPIVDLNRGPQKAYPKICIGRDDETDVPALSDALAKLVPLGLRVKAAEVRGKIGLSEPDAEDEVLTPPAAPAAPAEAGPGQAAELATARAAAIAADNADAIDDLQADALDGWEPAMEKIVAPLRALIGDAATLEELRDRLAEAIRDMDVDRLAELLARAAFAARLAGATGAEID